MKNIIFLIAMALIISMVACNNRVQVVPKDLIMADSLIDVNFKVYPDNDYYRPNNIGIYTADIELYLRAFQALNQNTPVKITFRSDNFGLLIIKKDTLYPDDQTNLKLADFTNFKHYAKFYSSSPGNQKLNFDLLISNTPKKASATFENR